MVGTFNIYSLQQLLCSCHMYVLVDAQNPWVPKLLSAKALYNQELFVQCLFHVFLFEFSIFSAHDMLVKHLVIGGLSPAACRIFFLGSRKAENRLTHHEWTGKKNIMEMNHES